MKQKVKETLIKAKGFVKDHWVDILADGMILIGVAGAAYCIGKNRKDKNVEELTLHPLTIEIAKGIENSRLRGGDRYLGWTDNNVDNVKMQLKDLGKFYERHKKNATGEDGDIVDPDWQVKEVICIVDDGKTE